jgi:hypothetical protein
VRLRLLHLAIPQQLLRRQRDLGCARILELLDVQDSSISAGRSVHPMTLKQALVARAVAQILSGRQLFLERLLPLRKRPG